MNEKLEKFERTIEMYKLNGRQLPSFELKYSGLLDDELSEILSKYDIEVIEKEYTSDNITSDMDPTETFFEHCKMINSRINTHIDGYDYIDVSINGDEVFVMISNSPIIGDEMYMSSDKNAKDTSVDEALEDIKSIYHNKNVKIIDLRK